MEKIGIASSITKLIKDHQFYIKKKYGQNFLVDQNILLKIVDQADITDQSLVIEIGPGFGSLTEHLIEKAKHVLAYEIDGDFTKHLRETFDKETFTLIYDDILKRDIDSDIASLKTSFSDIVLVANLPYYITTPVVMKVLEQTKSIQRIIVMMQYEVAKRMTSEPDKKDYNALSIAIQYRSDATYLFKVPRSVFIPKPNVDSAIIKLTVYDETPYNLADEQFFFKVVKTSFRQRRKTIYNNLKALEINHNDLKETIIKAGINPSIRAEALDLETFIILTNHLKETIQK